MTTLVWLAGTSLIWGALVWGAAIALQSGNDLSGRARQWIWRVAGLLLIAPWAVLPFADLLTGNLGVAPAPIAVLTDEPGIDVGVAPPAIAAGSTVETHGPVQGIDLPWVELIAGMIAVGWLVRAGAALQAARRLRTILRDSHIVDKGPARAALVRWSRRLGLRTTPKLLTVSANISPFSTGAARPVICLPKDIEGDMRADGLDLIIGHECIHVARGDGWLRPAERCLADAMWFNPFAWAIRRELDLARELACDEKVVALSSARTAYARTLRDVAGLSAGLPRSAPAASMSISGGGRVVAMRMERTLNGATRRPGKTALVGAAMLAIAAAPAAIAQAVLIDAVQPPEPPVAPPVPPVPPTARALARAPAPLLPPRAPDHVFTSADGLIRISFAAKVVATSGDQAQGYQVELLQTQRGTNDEICNTKLSGLSSLRVATDQLVTKGDVIGSGSNNLSFAIACSDDVAADGRPIPAAAPAPPPPPLSSRGGAPSPNAFPTPAAPLTSTTSATPQVAPTPPVATTPPIAPTRPVAATPAAEPIRFAPGAPVINGPARFTSGYGYRIDPFTQSRLFHEGVDIAAPRGTPVHAPTAGVVTFAGAKGAYGRLVELQLADTSTMRLGHLDEIKVQAGDQVAGGDVVGTVGLDSTSTGAHLHLEVFVSGKSRDPQTIDQLVLFGS